MKRTAILLLGLALTAAGCVELPTWTETKRPPVKESTPLVPMDPPPVAPEQVSETNAPKVLDSLREEMDRAANERTPGVEPKP
jgi:hypothetical protein